jgi:hypothetical protein
MTETQKMAKTAELIAAAKAAVAAFPQYRGHFDNYVLVVIRKNVRTKMGLAFERGEYAVARPTAQRIEYGRNAGKYSRIVYSNRNGIDTSILASDYKLV